MRLSDLRFSAGMAKATQQKVPKALWTSWCSSHNQPRSHRKATLDRRHENDLPAAPNSQYHRGGIHRRGGKACICSSEKSFTGLEPEHTRTLAVAKGFLHPLKVWD